MDLEFKGVTSIQDKEVKIIEGAFGEGKKCILASDIAIQHETRLDKVNDLIRTNINRFNDSDLIDLKSKPCEGLQLINIGFTQMQISKANNIFLLSERGYQKLVSMMSNDNEKKWEVMDKIIDNYFTMREIVKSDEQKKKDLIYKLYEGGVSSVDAHKQLLELEVKEVTKPLLETIEVQEPKVYAYEKFINSDGFISVDDASKYLKVGKIKMLQGLRDFKMLKTDVNEKNGRKYYNENHNMPYAKYDKYFRVIPLSRNKFTGKMDKKLYVTPEGLVYISKRLKF